MIKYVALISYLGTDFLGWQRQKIAPNSVQEILEKALLRMTGEKVSCVASGRTDSGVHAIGQVVHFVLRNKEWEPYKLHRGLNGILPKSIRVLALQPVRIEFHSQRSALKKQYSYYFQQGPCAIPHFEPLTRWINKPLDLDAMRRGLEVLVGQHDFKSFQASGAKPGPTVRQILEAEVTFEQLPFPFTGFLDQSAGLVRIRIIGTGFLKQMVRGIAGTLLQIGDGRRPSTCMQEILDSKDRDLVGPTAPARALWLERVWYPEEFKLEW